MEQQTGNWANQLVPMKTSIHTDVRTQHCNGSTWGTVDSCGQPATKSSSSPQNSYFLPQLFQKMRQFLLNYFSFSKRSISLIEKEPDITETEGCQAQSSYKASGGASPPRNCLLLFPLPVPTRQVTQPWPGGMRGKLALFRSFIL